MSVRAVVTVPGLRLFNPLNGSLHWAERARRAREQVAAVRVALAQLGTDVRNELRAARAVRVRITRVGGKRMDNNGACAAIKWVEDTVADWLRPGLAAGRADDAKHGVSTEYPPGQESGAYGVRIELEGGE